MIIMGRFPQSVGSKGSRKWIQILINRNVEILDAYLNKMYIVDEEAIKWYSPLKEDDYSEYRDQDFVEKLGISLRKMPLSCF